MLHGAGPKFHRREPVSEMRQIGPDAGIVRIWSGGSSTHCGMGILVRPNLVVTCSHVVNLAIGRDILAGCEPAKDSRVRVSFPIVADEPRQTARIHSWSDPSISLLNDVCVLILEDEAPVEAGIAIMADITGMRLDNDRLSVFGFPASSDLGQHVDAEFKGQANAAWVQIDANSSSKVFIQPGFSGGAVWNREHECVVGMVVARQKEREVAYMLSARQLANRRDQVPIEKNSLSKWFSGSWTVFATGLFLLLLGHFIAERYDAFPDYLSFGFGNKVIASHYGMHIGAVLLPFFLWRCLSFCGAFRHHDWWMRIPQFGALRPAIAQPCRTRSAAIVTLVILIGVQLYMQGHFVRRWHKEGIVYIYLTSLPSHQANPGAKIPGVECFGDSVKLCTHIAAGRYSIVPGTELKYFDNTYHFGDLQAKNPNSVTFFPIFQPIAVIFLSILSAALGILIIIRVFQHSLSRQPASLRQQLCCEEDNKEKAES